MKSLNRKKPFGTVHGVGMARFEQDGVFFDGAGKEIAADGAPVEDPQPPAKTTKKGGKGKDDGAAAGEIDNQIDAQGALSGAE